MHNYYNLYMYRKTIARLLLGLLAGLHCQKKKYKTIQKVAVTRLVP